MPACLPACLRVPSPSLSMCSHNPSLSVASLPNLIEATVRSTQTNKRDTTQHNLIRLKPIVECRGKYKGQLVFGFLLIASVLSWTLWSRPLVPNSATHLNGISRHQPTIKRTLKNNGASATMTDQCPPNFLSLFTTKHTSALQKHNQQPTDNRHPATNNKQPTTNNQQPTTNSHPATNNNNQDSQDDQDNIPQKQQARHWTTTTTTTTTTFHNNNNNSNERPHGTLQACGLPTLHRQ